MRRFAFIGLAPVFLAFGGGPAAIAGGQAENLPRWEYRVLSKEQVLELGKKDLMAGLNVLGTQGWELAAVDTAYIFKRARAPGPLTTAELKQRLAAAEADVEACKDRLLWAELMSRKGFLSETVVTTLRSRLSRAELEADRARRDLDAQLLPTPKKAPAAK